MIETEDFTIKQVYEALKKDGFEHLRGEWTATDIHGAVFGACVLGQAAINLGVADNPDGGMDTSLKFNLLAQLNKFDVDPNSEWNHFNKSVGETIIYWNDLEMDTDEEDGNNVIIRSYFLDTYEEVTKMAYDVLSPHFDKVVTLQKKEWKSAFEIPLPPS